MASTFYHNRQRRLVAKCIHKLNTTLIQRSIIKMFASLMVNGFVVYFTKNLMLIQTQNDHVTRELCQIVDNA